MAECIEEFAPGIYPADRLEAGMHVRGVPCRPPRERWIVECVTVTYCGGVRMPHAGSRVRVTLTEPLPAGLPARRRETLHLHDSVEVLGPERVMVRS